MIPRPLRHAVLGCLTLAAACRSGTNYPEPSGPRYAGGAPSPRPGATPDTLRVVSFNVAFARHVDRAAQVLTTDAAVRDADVVLLQEMDSAGTQRLAGALGTAYVYYPAILHRRSRRQFGNAVLSRWPVVADAKLRLPHVSRYGRTQRTATAVTLQVGGTLLRVYSTHLGTVADVGSAGRRDQLRAILADAAAYPRVVVGGDMNSGTVGRVAAAAGYAWPTAQGPRTTRLGRWDHIFLKGLASPERAPAGTVLDVRGASDHRAVWAVAVVR